MHPLSLAHGALNPPVLVSWVGASAGAASAVLAPRDSQEKKQLFMQNYCGERHAHENGKYWNVLEDQV